MSGPKFIICVQLYYQYLNADMQCTQPSRYRLSLLLRVHFFPSTADENTAQLAVKRTHGILHLENAAVGRLMDETNDDAFSHTSCTCGRGVGVLRGC